MFSFFINSLCNHLVQKITYFSYYYIVSNIENYLDIIYLDEISKSIIKL